MRATRSSLVRWKAEQVVDVCWYRREDVRKNVPDVIIVHSQKKRRNMGRRKEEKKNQRAEDEEGEEGGEEEEEKPLGTQWGSRESITLGRDKSVCVCDTHRSPTAPNSPTALYLLYSHCFLFFSCFSSSFLLPAFIFHSFPSQFPTSSISAFLVLFPLVPFFLWCSSSEISQWLPEDES